jgi:hypothetical protein
VEKYEKGMHYLCAVPWVFFLTVVYHICLYQSQNKFTQMQPTKLKARRLARTGVLPSLVGGRGGMGGPYICTTMEAGAAQQRISLKFQMLPTVL